MSEISSRDLRNHAAEVLRRVEAGERLRIIVNGRAVAELVPITPPVWTSGASMERILLEARADARMMGDLASIRQQVVGPL